MKRHFGLDWLRIGAFVILILYHSALHFGPHPWVLRAHQTHDWLVWPLHAVSPWRLIVLFAVSGYATAAMIGSKGSVGAFFRERSSRLLIPLLFGITIVVPPQSWVRLIADQGYTGSFLQFWLTENFRFGPFLGRTLPHWEHLWFLGYLWAYTALLALFIALVKPWKNLAARAAGLLSRGRVLLILPISFLIVARLALMKLGLTGEGMFDDWLGDSHYVPAFLFGFLIARHAELWAAVRRCRSVAALLAMLSYGVIAGTIALYGPLENLPTAALAVESAADSVMAWSMMIVMFALADRVFNHDHRWRAPLAQAIFPAYLVHQSVIVLVGWALLDWHLPGAVAFGVIALSVVAVSALAYLLAVRVRWMGSLLGVAPKARVTKPPLAAAEAG